MVDGEGGAVTETELPLDGTPVQRRLAAAAIDLFYRQGALATPVRQITEACGMTPGALYNHFGSKDELLYTVVRDIHLRLEQAIADARKDVAGDPVAELRAIVGVYVVRHTDHRETARVANREYPLLTGAWHDEVVAIRRRLRDDVADVLLAGARRGVFRPPGGAGRAGAEGDGRTPALLTAIAILDMCVHISEWFNDGGPFSRTELQDHYARLALRMAGAGADGPPGPAAPTRPVVRAEATDTSAAAGPAGH